MSVKEFANALGVTPAYIWALESGTKTGLSRRLIELLSEKFHISKSWLLEDKGSMYTEDKISEELSHLFTPVPVVGKVPAGYPSEPVEVIGYQVFPEAPKNSKAMKVRGDSMAPTIKDGDYVLWIATTDYKHNDLVIVADEWGDIMLKRLKKKDNEIAFTSDNPEYPTFKPNEHYRIVGKVVKIIRIIIP